jgi:capsular polysaccharide biosynthesis protein
VPRTIPRPRFEPAPSPAAVGRSGDSGMELHDVGRRIVGHYAWLIALLIVAGALVGAATGAGQTSYTASARIVLDTPDPSTRQESTAIADTVRAIATSSSQVRKALRTAGISNRDALDVAEHHVTVTGLGSSAVVRLSVTDRDRHVAADLANALAAQVISTRTRVTNGGVPAELASLDKRISDANEKISETDATIDQLNVQVALAGNGQAGNDLRAKRDTASRRRDFLSQQRGVLESERISLLGTYALRPRPSIISRAAVPVHADSSGVLPYMILGALLGLVLGLGNAALAETIRPTVVGGNALARELDTPLLGTLPSGRGSDVSDDDLAPIAARVRLAAEAAEIDDVELIAITPERVDLPQIAERLQGNLGFGLGSRASRQAPASRLRVLTHASPAADDDLRATGLIIVSPTAVKKAAIADLGHLLRVTPLPVLGLITYRRARVSRPIRRAAGPAHASSKSATSS